MAHDIDPVSGMRLPRPRREPGVLPERLRPVDVPHPVASRHAGRDLHRTKAFPPPANEAELEMYAQGFAWSSHGIAPEVLEKLYDLLTPELRAKLPAARAAFEQRCKAVWGTSLAGSTRTSIPDL